MAVGAVAVGSLAWWLVRCKRAGATTLLDPDLFRFPHFRIGISQVMLQNIILSGAMIALPLYLQMTLEYNAMETGLALAPLSLSMFALAISPGRRTGRRRPAGIVLVGFALAAIGIAAIIPIMPRAQSGWSLVVPLLLTGCGLGLLVSQLNNYTLSPIDEERSSEAAGVNSAAGSFGLSFGLAMAGGILLAVLSFSFTTMTENSKVIPPAQQQQIATAMEDDAEVMSNTQLAVVVKDEPPAVQSEILAINSDARDISLQVALLVPALAALLGVINGFRMRRLPDIEPAANLEGLDFG
jgi:MFS family permease